MTGSITAGWRARAFLVASGCAGLAGLALFGLAHASAAGARPIVGGVGPTAGAQCGSTPVVISGSNFTGANLPGGGVSFGSVPAASFTVNGDTMITATPPHADAGIVDVTVTVPGFGTSTTSADDLYSFLDQAPSVSQVSPALGPAAGGAVVTITGTCFVDKTNIQEVDFGTTAVPQASLGSVTDTTIQVTSPAHAAGPVDVTVKNTSGDTGVAAGAFTYVAPPTVSGVAPGSGPTTGGTSVTVTGSGFRDGVGDGQLGSCKVSAISFGGTPATPPASCTDSSLSVAAPAHAAGQVDVTVTNDGGTSATSSLDHFTYVTPPTVTSVVPSRDALAGGHIVTVNGTGFFGGTGSCAVTGVAFGASAGTGVTCVNDGQLKVTDPAEQAGTVDVVVSTAGGGASTSSGADHFTYVAAPAVTSLNPTAGPTSGGTSVTVHGSGFFGGTGACDIAPSQVSFGSTAATGSVTGCSDSAFTVSSPAGSAATVDVTVTNGVGEKSATSAGDEFTYANLPTVTGISPNVGPAGGGTVVTVTGTNFFVNGACGVTSVTFGGTPGTGLASCTSGTPDSIQVSSPGGPAGTVDVQVTTAGGTSATNGSDIFRYAPAPTVASVNPRGGTTAGGTTVTISGTGFDDGGSGCHVTAVHFGSVAANVATIGSCTSGTSFTISSPAQAQNIVDITVTTDGGTSATSNADQYSYVAPVPAVTNVSPARGPVEGGQQVTISGSGFTGVTGVAFGSNNASAFSAPSDSTITVTEPASAAAGPVDVRVTTAGGTSPVTSADHYQYVADPTVTGLSVVRGPMEGGTSTIVTGTGFWAGTASCKVTAVEFGATPGSGMPPCSDTSLTIVSPAESAGTVDVMVTDDLGQTSAANPPADQFKFVADPAVTGLSVARGPVEGGTSVIVSGTGFWAGTASCKVTAVDFGATPGTGLTSCSDSSLTITSPAGQPGTVDVSVTNDLKQTSAPDSRADQFKFVADPAVTSVSPPHGDPSGGTSVTIGGSGFWAGTTSCKVTAVDFGGSAATLPDSCSDGSITVTSPAGSLGTVDVTLSDDLGQSSAVNRPDDEYTYSPAPAISSLGPDHGLYTDGTPVTIKGSGFDGASGACDITSITFGGVAAPVPASCTDDQAMTTAPAAPQPGIVQVVVTTADGGESAEAAYTYQVLYSFAWYDLKSSPGFKSDNIHLAVASGSLSPSDVTVSIPGCTPVINAFNSQELIAACAPGTGFGGPVTVLSDRFLQASQRVRYYNTFNEVPGAPMTDADTSWQFAWYDHRSDPGFQNDNIHIWNPVGPLSTSDVTSVQIPDCDSPVASQQGPDELVYSCAFGSGYGGPVSVTTTVPVLASQRVQYYQSFNEVLAQAPGAADTDKEFAWYDHASDAGFRSDNIHVWDPTGAALSSADVTVDIPGCNSVKVDPIGAELVYSCPFGSGFGGPATITATVPVLASQRVQYYQSFNEVPAASAGDAAGSITFAWYDHQSDPRFVNDNLHVWNPSGALSPSDLDVVIPGCSSMTVDPVGTSELVYSCPFGDGGFGGPVTITANGGVQVLASQRVQYGQSFNEVLGGG